MRRRIRVFAHLCLVPVVGILSRSFTAEFIQQSRFHDFFIRREDFTQKSVPRFRAADRVAVGTISSWNFTAKFSYFFAIRPS